jgi:peptidoglycan-associated lipoprotein
MIMMNEATGRIGTTLAMVSVLVAGCAHVNEGQLATEIDVLREEMRGQDRALREQDRALEERVTERIDELSDDVDRRVSLLADELGELRGEFEITVERLDAAVRFNTPIHFAFDDATVRQEDQLLLDRFARVVGAYYNQAIIAVEGFADPAGSAEYNLALGERRAEAVKEYLESVGVPADRMRTVSYGEAPERQIVVGSAGPGDAGWQNRRVALVIDFSGAIDGPSVALN